MARAAAYVPGAAPTGKGADSVLTRGKSFITLRGMSAEAISLAVRELSERPLPDGTAPPTRDGRAVATAFYEASTRTRLGFQFAARALGLDVIPLDVSASSVGKGESLTDTVPCAGRLRHRGVDSPSP